MWDARPWTPELKTEHYALCMLRSWCAKPISKEQLIEKIRTDRTIPDLVRKRALELAPLYWERSEASGKLRTPPAE